MSSTALYTKRTPVASTPKKQTVPATAITESPGNWRHPRLKEITRRRNATVFGERNVKMIIYNGAALILLYALHTILARYSPSQLFSKATKTYLLWAYYSLQLLPLINMGIAILPLIRRADDLSDIPLTPAQRKLLGLPPSSAPATPGSVYSTPPRYSRTPSIAGSAGSKASYTSSPLSKPGSPASGGRLGGSPYSPIASPLLQKAVGGGVNGARRSSFGSPGPLGASTASSLFPDAPGTPSPTSGKRTSVGLNNKWLYEKGRRTSGSTWL